MLRGLGWPSSSSRASQQQTRCSRGMNKMTNRNQLGRWATGLLVVPLFLGTATAPQAQHTPVQQQGPRWDSLPLMKLEAFYRGPLMDTVIQRWRDPVDGSICYLYMPISAEHAQTPNSPYVQYGANQIGSISCFAQPAAALTAPPVPGQPKSSKAKPPTPKPRELVPQ